jgi:two-component system cell cycle response regulator DivK
MMALVLLVEDDEDSRRIVRTTLTRAGHEMVEAVTGPDGVTAAQTHLPDLILMDIQLPGFDGLKTTRRLKADPALQHIPILAVTSYIMSEDESRALEAGCNGFVSKPFSPRALLDTISGFLP